MYGKSQALTIILYNRIQLFYDKQLVHALRQLANQLLRKRIDHTELQNADRISEDLLHILIARRGCNNSQLPASPLNPVKRTIVRIFRQTADAFLHDRMTTDCITRCHYVFCDILHIRESLRQAALTGLYNALGMCYPRAHLDDNRRIKFFGKHIRLLRKFICLARVRRLQHRQLRRNRIVAGILFVLRGMHTRVICHTNDKAGIHSRICTGKQRIRCNIQAHMLHTAEAASARK